jgi:hypothetical protein
LTKANKTDHADDQSYDSYKVIAALNSFGWGQPNLFKSRWERKEDSKGDKSSTAREEPNKA